MRIISHIKSLDGGTKDTQSLHDSSDLIRNVNVEPFLCCLIKSIRSVGPPKTMNRWNSRNCFSCLLQALDIKFNWFSNNDFDVFIPKRDWWSPSKEIFLRHHLKFPGKSLKNNIRNREWRSSRRSLSQSTVLMISLCNPKKRPVELYIRESAV